MPSVRRQLMTFALVLVGLYIVGFVAGTIIDDEKAGGGAKQEQMHESGH